MRGWVVGLLILGACDRSPKPASRSEVTDLKTQIGALQAQLQEESELRARADEERDEAIAALRAANEAGPDPLVTALRDQVADLTRRVEAVEALSAAANAWIGEEGVPASEALDALAEDLLTLQGQLDTLDTQATVAFDTVGLLATEVRLLDEDTRLLLAYLSVDRDASAVVIEGANLYVQSGAGATDAEPNGLGNLIVGYDEGDRSFKSGSHNLIVGPGHAYTSWGGVAFGSDNVVTAASASVLGGAGNRATFERSVVIGGVDNMAGAPDDIAP